MRLAVTEPRDRNGSQLPNVGRQVRKVQLRVVKCDQLCGRNNRA